MFDQGQIGSIPARLEALERNHYCNTILLSSLSVSVRHQEIWDPLKAGPTIFSCDGLSYNRIRSSGLQLSLPSIESEVHVVGMGIKRYHCLAVYEISQNCPSMFVLDVWQAIFPKTPNGTISGWKNCSIKIQGDDCLRNRKKLLYPILIPLVSSRVAKATNIQILEFYELSLATLSYTAWTKNQIVNAMSLLRGLLYWLCTCLAMGSTFLYIADLSPRDFQKPIWKIHSTRRPCCNAGLEQPS